MPRGAKRPRPKERVATRMLRSDAYLAYVDLDTGDRIILPLDLEKATDHGGRDNSMQVVVELALSQRAVAARAHALGFASVHDSESLSRAHSALEHASTTKMSELAKRLHCDRHVGLVCETPHMPILSGVLRLDRLHMDDGQRRRVGMDTVIAHGTLIVFKEEDDEQDDA